MSARRALHFVFKVGDRRETIKFFKDILQMRILRHEEFTEGCKASCNGPYDGKWSKTMVGYGPEDNHFVMELTYNYGIGSYKLGNDFQWILIQHPDVFSRIHSGSWPFEKLSDGTIEVKMPGGYRFRICNKPSDGDPVKMVALSCSSLQRSIDYWSKLCGMGVLSSTDQQATLSFNSRDQCSLVLIPLSMPIDHASAFGRIAFACPRDQLPELQRQMEVAKETILKPLVSLDTPGKATVEVVILADPDGHEICFVGDEAFRELSQVDPKADQLLEEAMNADKSDAWFEKHGGKSNQ